MTKVSRSAGRTCRAAISSTGAGSASQVGARASRSAASSAPSASSARASAAEKNSANSARRAPLRVVANPRERPVDPPRPSYVDYLESVPSHHPSIHVDIDSGMGIQPT